MADVEFVAPPPLRTTAAKPKMNVYYALLIISLCAMLVACLFLYLEIKRNGGFGAVKGKISLIERPAHSLVAGTASSAGLVPPLNHA